MVQLGIHQRHYPLHTVAPYINWVYFFHAWGFAPKFATLAGQCGCEACRKQWISGFPIAEQPKANEAQKLWKEAQRMLNLLDAQYRVHGCVNLMECNAQGNDILLYTPDKGTVRFPLLRQQSGTPPYLCLSDFIRPESCGKDIIGLFATTVDEDMERMYEDEDYKHLLVQTLADRLAEAMAEKLHEEVRKELWGFAPDENLTTQQMNDEKFQGIRPAVGYPSLPDISINRLLSELTPMKSIGIHLTENAMMQPHASVSGLMMAHPQSRYFSIGKIGEDQLHDYARRRECDTNEIRKFLLNNL